MNTQSNHNLMLHLKALIWSIYVSYGKETVMRIVHAVEEGKVPEDHPDFHSSHLGICLKYILNHIQSGESLHHLAECLREVQGSETSMIYQNMVFEIGHYVSAKESSGTIPEDCPGVVYHIQRGKIQVLFKKPDQTLEPATRYPDELMPVYTLTIPDSSA